MMNVFDFVDWKKCTGGKVPVVIQRSLGIIWGVAWLGAEELRMMMRLEFALALSRRKESRFYTDCDCDAMLFLSDDDTCDQFWLQIPSAHWSLCIQTPHDVRLLLQPNAGHPVNVGRKWKMKRQYDKEKANGG